MARTKRFNGRSYTLGGRAPKRIKTGNAYVDAAIKYGPAAYEAAKTYGPPSVRAVKAVYRKFATGKRRRGPRGPWAYRRGPLSQGRMQRPRMRGIYKGRFRRRTSRRTNPYYSKGYHARHECGGTVEDASASYISLGATPVRGFVEAVGGSLWKVIWEREWHNMIDSWENAITRSTSDNFAWLIIYKTSQDGVLSSTQSAVINGGQTHLQMAAALMDVIMSIMNSNVYFELVELEVYHRRDLTVDDYINQLRVKAIDFRFYFNCKGHVKCQNRTLAATGTADESSMLDVANNPLEGKIYRGTGTVISMKHQQNTAGGNANFYNRVADGVGVLASASQNMPGLMTKCPPYHALQHMKSSKNVRLGPGMIKSEYVSWKGSFTFRSFIKFFYEWLRSGSSLNTGAAFPNVHIPVVIIGMERMLDSRLAEPSVALSYQADHEVQVICNYTKTNFSVPRVVLNGTAISLP